MKNPGLMLVTWMFQGFSSIRTDIRDFWGVAEAHGTESTFVRIPKSQGDGLFEVLICEFKLHRITSFSELHVKIKFFWIKKKKMDVCGSRRCVGWSSVNVGVGCWIVSFLPLEILELLTFFPHALDTPFLCTLMFDCLWLGGTYNGNAPNDLADSTQKILTDLFPSCSCTISSSPLLSSLLSPLSYPTCSPTKPLSERSNPQRWGDTIELNLILFLSSSDSLPWECSMEINLSKSRGQAVMVFNSFHNSLCLFSISLADPHHSAADYHLQWPWYLFFFFSPLTHSLVGTCVPICLAAYLLRVLAFSDSIYRPYIVFAESYCRVQSLSLTGKILYPIADRFIVQWETLLTPRYPRAQFIGKICWIE